MMNARTPNQYADDALVTELRALFDEVDRAEAARPATMPPWDRVLAFMEESRKLRRRNRFRRTVAAGAALAIGVVVVGAAVGVVPKLRSSSIEPATFPPVPSTRVTGHSLLYGTPARGSLASDTTWLKQLQEFASQPKNGPDPDDWITPPPAHQVSVLYASDVGMYRVALIEGDYTHTRRNATTGTLASRKIPRQYWLVGAKGAAPQTMRLRETSAVKDLQTVIVNRGTYPVGRAVDHAVAVITVSPRPVRVRLAQQPTIDAVGLAHSPGQVLTPKGGVYESFSTRAPMTTVFVNGERSGSFNTLMNPAMKVAVTDEALTPQRGGSVDRFTDPDDLGLVKARKAFHNAAGEALSAAGQRPGTGEFRMLAAEEGNRTASIIQRAVVFTVRLPSGARVLVASGVPPGPNFTQGYGTRTEAMRLLPAGSDDNATIAWVHVKSRAAWSGALGPKGTTKVEWVHSDGSVSTTTAYHSLATVGRADIVSVRFVGAGGKHLGTAGITPKDNRRFGIFKDVLAAQESG